MDENYIVMSNSGEEGSWEQHTYPLTKEKAINYYKHVVSLSGKPDTPYEYKRWCVAKILTEEEINAFH